MPAAPLQHVHVHLSGQDDNLGDSVLRDGLLRALRGPNRVFHVLVNDHRGNPPSSDYLTGLSLGPSDTVYATRREWLSAGDPAVKPVHVFNAGEINPPPSMYPPRARQEELARVRKAGGAVIITGVGIKDPNAVPDLRFGAAFREAQIVSWRDSGSRELAGFGDVNPDWAFSLGTPTSEWQDRNARPLLAITLRFDRPYPDTRWFDAVRALARRTGTRIVTIAQVARDAPRAVQVAAELGGEYLVPPSFSHGVLNTHVREVFTNSLAVISDRAHGLIIAATEGAYPIGSGSHPQKIARLLSTVGLGELVGHYDDLPAYIESLDEHLPSLKPTVDVARAQLDRLTIRMQALMNSIEPLS